MGRKFWKKKAKRKTSTKCYELVVVGKVPKFGTKRRNPENLDQIGFFTGIDKNTMSFIYMSRDKSTFRIPAKRCEWRVKKEYEGKVRDVVQRGRRKRVEKNTKGGEGLKP